jgi:hypothetical protein
MSHGPDFTPVYESMANRSENKNLKMACFAGMAIGLAATAYGIFTPGEMVPDPEGLKQGVEFSTNTLRVQGSFLQNFMYFNGAAQGGFLMTVIGVTTYARWTRPFKRVAEGLAMFLPVSYALLLLFLALGGIEVFPWHNQGV